MRWKCPKFALFPVANRGHLLCWHQKKSIYILKIDILKKVENECGCLVYYLSKLFMDFHFNFVSCGAQQSEKDVRVIEFSHRRRDDSLSTHFKFKFKKHQEGVSLICTGKQISLEVSFEFFDDIGKV